MMMRCAIVLAAGFLMSVCSSWAMDREAARELLDAMSTTRSLVAQASENMKPWERKRGEKDYDYVSLLNTTIKSCNLEGLRALVSEINASEWTPYKGVFIDEAEDIMTQAVKTSNHELIELVLNVNVIRPKVLISGRALNYATDADVVRLLVSKGMYISIHPYFRERTPRDIFMEKYGEAEWLKLTARSSSEKTNKNPQESSVHFQRNLIW